MASSTEPNGAAAPSPRTFLGHPIGLYILFFTEMWERFSFYGMRALLMLYMVNYFRWDQKDASNIYKWYTSLVYLTPLLGGFLADRYLGNKRAVIIGAILMAIGHFLMAFEQIAIFYWALGFLIMGNGFFKPNMSTQVGRLYPTNDPRRDGAYTIFYMGINLGAFLAPLLCGWLQENTSWGYHAGFTAAGVGMVIGLFTYVFGLPLVKELDANTPPHSDTTPIRSEAPDDHPADYQPADVPTEAECEKIPTAAPLINRLTAKVLVLVGIVTAIGPLLVIGVTHDSQLSRWLPWGENLQWHNAALDELSSFCRHDFFFLELTAICAFIAAWLLTRVHQAVRDRVLSVYALFMFAVFFWAGYEQAGNVLNVWADQSTDRYIWTESHSPPLKPGEKDVRAPGWFAGLFNPTPTAWFQSINALAIVLLAPLIAWLWTATDRRGYNLTIPLKMAMGIFLLSLSFALMVGAAQSENQPTPVQLAKLPSGVSVNADHQLCPLGEDGKPGAPFFAGRLIYDPAAKTLTAWGPLPIVERDRILAETTPKAFIDQIKELNKQAAAAKGDVDVSARLKDVPPRFDWTYTDFTDPKTDEVYCTYNPDDKKIHLKRELADKDILAISVAASDPAFRDVMNTVVTDSSKTRVSWWWLFWAYMLSTLGELCLSPVGLSMVSKLAPAKYATMLMGLWLLTNTFGLFLAGEMGERYGVSWTPTQYFAIFFVATLIASLILFMVLKKIEAMMHGVR